MWKGGSLERRRSLKEGGSYTYPYTLTWVPPPPAKPAPPLSRRRRWNEITKLCISMLWLKSHSSPCPTHITEVHKKKNPNKQYLCYSLVKRSMHLTRAHHATVYDVNCNAPIWPARGPCLIAFNLGYITACGQTIFWLTACGQTITASGQLICTGSGQVTASGCRLLGVRHLDAV